MVCGGKKSITKTREKGGEEKCGPSGCVSRAWSSSGQAGQWRGLPFHCLSLQWYNLEKALLLKALSEWHMGRWFEAQLPRASSRPQVFLWESTERLFCFFKQQQPPSPSLIHCLSPSVPPSLSVALSLSLFFSLFLRHSLVTAWSSNPTTLFLTRTGSPEIPRRSPWVPTPKMKKKK